MCWDVLANGSLPTAELRHHFMHNLSQADSLARQITRYLPVFEDKTVYLLLPSGADTNMPIASDLYTEITQSVAKHLTEQGVAVVVSPPEDANTADVVAKLVDVKAKGLPNHAIACLAFWVRVDHLSRPDFLVVSLDWRPHGEGSRFHQADVVWRFSYFYNQKHTIKYDNEGWPLIVRIEEEPNHGLESTSAPPAAGTLETHP